MWPVLRASALRLDEWAAERSAGERVPRALGDVPVSIGGVATTRKLMTFPLWMAQRPIRTARAWI